MARGHRITLPRGVWFQPKRLRTGEVIRYGYWGRGPGTVALGRFDSPEFFERLAEAMRKEPPGKDVENLIWRYRQSPEFQDLRPLTRRDYLRELDRISDRFGSLSLRAMAAREIAAHIYAFRDERAGSPRRADYSIQVLKALLSWGVKRGHLEHNRAAGVERIYRSHRSGITWTQAQIDAFMGAASEPLQRAMILALETGQRQSDLLALPWTAVKEGTIRLKQSKTGVAVTVPISPALEAAMETWKRTAVTILTKVDGHSWEGKGNGFRSAWRDACVLAKVEGVTFHDLRGTFVTRRLAEGWTTQDVAMCTGHSLRDLASLDTYADRELIADATAKRLAKRMREPKT